MSFGAGRSFPTKGNWMGPEGADLGDGAGDGDGAGAPANMTAGGLERGGSPSHLYQMWCRRLCGCRGPLQAVRAC